MNRFFLLGPEQAHAEWLHFYRQVGVTMPSAQANNVLQVFVFSTAANTALFHFVEYFYRSVRFAEKPRCHHLLNHIAGRSGLTKAE